MKKIVFFICYSLIILSCRKNLEEQIVIDTPFMPPVIEISNPITASVFGMVTDQNGTPVVEAKVTLFGNSVLTNIRGQFVFSKVVMDEDATYITVEKEGYFLGSDRIYPRPNSQNYTEIELIREQIIGRFSSADGGVVTTSDGLQITFPANGIVDNHGNIYGGLVDVYAYWLDPTADNIHRIMPGDLIGQNSMEQEVALSSYSMAAIELQSESGEKLNLGNNQLAKITFPIPNDLLANAPSEIPLWSFDEALGIWQQEGKNAVLINGTYEGEVAHFSFWNCDAPFPLIELSGQFITPIGTPLMNHYFFITVLNTGEQRVGITDSEGFFKGKVPANEEIELKVSYYENCPNMFTIGLMPSSVNIDLGPTSVNPNADFFTISGTVTNCDGNDVAIGAAKIQLDGVSKTFFFEDAGDFEFGIWNCDEANNYVFSILDLQEGLNSSTITGTLDGADIAIGEVSACGNSLENYMKVTIDDNYTIYTEAISAGFRANMDTMYINGFTNLNYVRLNVQPLDEGVYDPAQSIFGMDASFAYPHSQAGLLFSSCTLDVSNCELFEYTVIEYNGVNERITAKLNGESIFEDPAGNTYGPFSIEAEFQTIVQ